MIHLKSTDNLRVVTGSAAVIDVLAIWTDIVLATGATTPDRTPTLITTATTTPIVAAPSAGTVRGVKSIFISNDGAVTSSVAVEFNDGTNVPEVIQVTLLPGENLHYENDRWIHHDANGAEYPPAGLGRFNGRGIAFMKPFTAADAAGYWYSTAKDAGFPGAWAPGTPGVNGRQCSGYTGNDAGALIIPDPSSGANYITSASLQNAVTGVAMLYDVLWVNSGLVITTTTAQTFASGAMPARDINGSTNGDGLMLAILCTGAVGLAATAANATITYTNQSGTGSRTATLSAVVGSQAPATPVVGTMVLFNLQAGDTGVRSVEGVTLGTSWVSGTISVMVIRPILYVGAAVANVAVPPVTFDPGVRIFNGSCLHWAHCPSGTGTGVLTGGLTVMER